MIVFWFLNCCLLFQSDFLICFRNVVFVHPIMFQDNMFLNLENTFSQLITRFSCSISFLYSRNFMVMIILGNIACPFHHQILLGPIKLFNVIYNTFLSHIFNSTIRCYLCNLYNKYKIHGH